MYVFGILSTPLNFWFLENTKNVINETQSQIVMLYKIRRNAAEKRLTPNQTTLTMTVQTGLKMNEAIG